MLGRNSTFPFYRCESWGPGQAIEKLCHSLQTRVPWQSFWWRFWGAEDGGNRTLRYQGNPEEIKTLCDWFPCQTLRPNVDRHKWAHQVELDFPINANGALLRDRTSAFHLSIPFLLTQICKATSQDGWDSICKAYGLTHRKGWITDSCYYGNYHSDPRNMYTALWDSPARPAWGKIAKQVWSLQGRGPFGALRHHSWGYVPARLHAALP